MGPVGQGVREGVGAGDVPVIGDPLPEREVKADIRAVYLEEAGNQGKHADGGKRHDNRREPSLGVFSHAFEANEEGRNRQGGLCNNQGIHSYLTQAKSLPNHAGWML